MNTLVKSIGFNKPEHKNDSFCMCEKFTTVGAEVTGAGSVRLQTSDTSLGVFDKLTLAYTECQTQLVKYTK